MIDVYKSGEYVDAFNCTYVEDHVFIDEDNLSGPRLMVHNTMRLHGSNPMTMTAHIKLTEKSIDAVIAALEDYKDKIKKEGA